jgi:hypothetical protein
MRYYDFEANWEEFYKHLHSPKITKLLTKVGLSHPLYRCSRGDGIVTHIDMLVENDPEYQKQNKELVFEDEDDDEAQEAFFSLHDKFYKKYSEPKMIHTNIPSGRCHQIAIPLMVIAQQMYPKYTWVLLNGNKHSTVYTKDDGGIMFDLLMWFIHRTDKRLTADSVYLNAQGKKGKNYDKDIYNTQRQFVNDIDDIVL